MKYPEAYVRYLVHFHGDRDWFECHEILEEYWKDQKMTNQVWVTLIQIAVGLYHQRRGNLQGASKMLNSAYNRIDDTAIREIGLDPELLNNSLKTRIVEISTVIPFTDFNLPIMDPQLLNRCQDECTKKKMIWQAASNMVDERLIHKHSRRDRSGLLKQREERLKEVKNERSV
ncbi:MAG TPA: DUF309 domain-containing protein [Bacillota bacterium]|nr:DUF309 domain-containing protein [Bacillota bacterium]